MKISRIDQIALNGGDGMHYKYEDVAVQIAEIIPFRYDQDFDKDLVVAETVKILVENFPNDET